MKKCEVRKKIIWYKRDLDEIKTLYITTANEKDNKTKEMKALKKKIKELENELYDGKQ